MRTHEYKLHSANGGTRMRSIHDDMGFLLAVDPFGKIRTLHYGLNGTSSKLRSKEIVHNGRLVGREGIAVDDKYRDLGWRHLDELYESEVKEKGLEGEDAQARMRDYEQIVKIYRKASALKGGKLNVEIDPAYLPDALLDTYKNPAKPNDLDLAPPSKPAQAEIKATKRAAK